MDSDLKNKTEKYLYENNELKIFEFLLGTEEYIYKITKEATDKILKVIYYLFKFEFLRENLILTQKNLRIFQL